MVPHLSGRDRDLPGEPPRKRSSLSGLHRTRDGPRPKPPIPRPNLKSQSTLSVYSPPALRDKLQCFRKRDAIMCPSSPPIRENSNMSEQESLRRSRKRIAAMSRRLAELPLCRARCSINLACTQLRGPFSEGCRYWGISPPTEIGSSNKISNVPPVASTSRLTDFPPAPAMPRKVYTLPDTPPPSDPPTLPEPQITLAAQKLPTPPTTERRPAQANKALHQPSTPPKNPSAEVKLTPSKTAIRRSIPPVNDASSRARGISTPSPNLPPPRLSQVPSASHPPETPKSHLSQAIPRPPTRAPSSAARWSSRPLNTQIFPPAGQPGLKHSTPLRRDGSADDDEPLSRESSPLLRFSQIEPSRIVMGTSSQRPPPARFSPHKILSQRESSGDEFFNSQFNFDRQLKEITSFMEGDIAN